MTGQAENGCAWHFAEQNGGTDIGPNDAMSQIFKKDKFRALVRESGGNIRLGYLNRDFFYNELKNHLDVIRSIKQREDVFNNDAILSR